MSIGRAVGRQMSDVFSDYILKSRKTVEESPRGQKKAKPAASYIKEMQRKNVPTEEMRDLGLLDDYDPKKGPLRNKRMTREEILSDIDARRAERLQGEATVRQIDPFGQATTPDESVDAGAPMFPENVPDIGNKESYQEIVYSQRGGEQSRLNEALGSDPSRLRDMQGMHFTETDQLFHLRVNRGTTEDQDSVTNILEIQSDIQQRKQQPPKTERLKQIAASDPDLPMVENWEKLGVKEAIKLAIKRGDRYVAVAPGNEIAESVAARQVVPEFTEAFVKIERGVDPVSGKEGDLVTLEPAGINVLDRYNTMIADTENILDESALKADFDLLDEIAGYEVNRDELEPFVDLYIRSKFSAYSDRIRMQDRDRSLIDKYETRISEMLEAEGQEPMSFTEFMEQYVISDSVVQELGMLEDDIAESGAQSAFEITRKYFADEVAEELGISVSDLKKVAKNNKPIEIPAGTGFGGKGIKSFYDKKMLSPERVKEYGEFPVVTIKQYRSSTGDTVETQALDLQEYYKNQLLDKKNKQMSLYSPAAVGLFASYLASKFMFGGTQSQDQQPPQNEGPMMADGGLLDEGGTVDPVSGNDVPPGSTQEEVRDDIPAQLSEGEFVFPADVVRYIGLDRLMELRQEAKHGLQKMDDMGQMGNSEEAVMPDTVPHESMEFQQGGVVPASNVPTFYGQETPSYMEAGAVQTAPKFAGQTQQSTQSVYQPSQFQQVQPIVGTPAQPGQVTGPEQDAPTSQLPYEMKRFVNEAGNVVYIPFMNGQPQFPIPEGYEEQKRMEAITGPTEEETPATDTAVQTTTVTDTGGGDGPDTSPTTQAKVDPVAGIARGFAEFNPNSKVASSMKDYKNAQVKGIAGAALSVLSGNPIGAGVSLYRMNQKMNEYKDEAFGALPPEVQNQITRTVGEGQTQYMTTDQFTNRQAQDAYTSAVQAGASPAFAAALATSTGAFRGAESRGIPVTEVDIQTGQETTRGGPMDLGAYERSVAGGLGTQVGSAQTAMLGEQEMGLFDSVADREAFYSQEGPSRRSAPEVQTSLDFDRMVEDEAVARGLATRAPRRDIPTVEISPRTPEPMGRDVGAEIEATERQAQEVSRGDRDVGGSDFGSKGEADAVADSGWGSDDHFDSIDDQFDSLDDDSDSGDSGDDGGRWCCSRMVHHELWTVEREFARLSAWSRKQPNWWRSGYPIWGKVVAKHLLAKEGFWTGVMQAFYDNHVMKKKRTLKSTLADVIIFPGSFICGLVWKDIPNTSTLADPREFN